MAARRPENQALMVGSDSGSESDVTEFGRDGRNKAKNGLASNIRGPKGNDRGTTRTNNSKMFALTLSALLNVVLVVVLIVIKSQPPPSINHQFPSNQDNSGVPQHHKSTSTSTVEAQPLPPSSHPISPPPPQTLSTNTPAQTTRAVPEAANVLPNAPPQTNCVTSQVTCGTGSEHVQAPTDENYVNVFQDLTSDEIHSTLDYLLRQRELGLQMNPQQGSYVASVELHVPTKSSSLDFLDKALRQPPREALTTVVLTQNSSPIVRQYVVGPLPSPTYHKVNPRMTKDVPASKMTMYGFGEAYQFVYRQMAEPEVQSLLLESFGAVSNCTGGWRDPCLMILGQKISFGLMNQTSFAFSTYYNAEFPTIHPVPFQLVISKTPQGYFVVKVVYYAGSSFSTMSELITRYQAGSIRKASRKYPGNVPGESSIAGSLNLRGAPFPKSPHPPPRQYEPKGRRYSIVDQHVKERIVYELSLQEIVVLYAGANPAAMFAHLSDSAFGLGDNARSMVPGVDCPEHASFLSTWFYNSKRMVPQVENIPNTVCVFEHNSGVPLRRHRFENKGHMYSGLVDHYLVVRTIIVEYNYDYVIDVVFHNNGAIETRVYATGYVMSQWYHYGEDPFGFNVHDDVVGSIHHHLFHIKVDMDVGGVNNRYETLDFTVDERSWPWLSAVTPSAKSSSGKFQQISFKHHLRKTEKDALYHYNFDTPKYHVYYSNNVKNKFGNPRAYRISAHGFSKQLLPDAHPGLRSRKWVQPCMAVTTRKEAESKSSSVFSMYDGDDPVVNFEDFHKDDESIVDKDLVTWVTLGMHHIPHTEDIPNTPTVGTEASILLLPFNYFPECPSMRSRDAVRAEHSAQDGVTRFETYGSQTDFTCTPLCMAGSGSQNPPLFREGEWGRGRTGAGEGG